MSTMILPSARAVTLRGLISSCMVILGLGCAWSLPPGSFMRSACFHAESSYCVVLHPVSSRRASYSSPSNSLLATMGPREVTRHEVSLTTASVVPSAYSISSRASSDGSPKCMKPPARMVK